MLRITRHPFLWGAAIWALGHLLVNGDAVSIILFGSILVLSLFGTASIDASAAARWAPNGTLSPPRPPTSPSWRSPRAASGWRWARSAGGRSRWASSSGA